MSGYVYRAYECPHCHGQFGRVVELSAEPPARCELCGKSVLAPKPRRPRDRNVTRNISKSVDRVYRGMESASEQRAAAAAEALGLPASAMSAMKMTDMKDGLRIGECSQPADATKLTGQSDTQVLESSGKTFTPFSPAAVAEARQYASGAGTAAAPTGINALNVVSSLHATKGAGVVAAGRLNRGK